MSRWAALELELPAGTEDELLGIVARGSLGAEVGPAEGGRCRLRVYFSTPDEAAAARGRLRAGRGRLGLRGESLRTRILPVEDGLWVERYVASLVPFPVGRKFLVVPGEVPADLRGREPLRIVPGCAFGTGEHPTTRLAVEALEEAVRPLERWLDVGTGTGLLAIVAARCGAGSVAACDTDPAAIEVARETFEANGLAGRIELELGSADRFPRGAFDGVVANLSPAELVPALPAIAGALRPGGLLLVTGFLETEGDHVERVLGGCGVPREDSRSRDGWLLIGGRRRVTG